MSFGDEPVLTKPHRLKRVPLRALRGPCGDKRGLESRINDVHESVAVEDTFSPNWIKVSERFGGDGLFE